MLTPSAEPSGPFRQLHQPALEGLQIGQHLGQQIQHQSQPPLHMLGIEIVGIKLAQPMMKAQSFAQPTRGSGADQRRAVVGGDAETLQQASMPVGPIGGAAVEHPHDLRKAAEGGFTLPRSPMQPRVMARGAPGSLVCGCTICTNQGEL